MYVYIYIYIYVYICIYIYIYILIMIIIIIINRVGGDRRQGSPAPAGCCCRSVIIIICQTLVPEIRDEISETNRNH